MLPARFFLNKSQPSQSSWRSFNSYGSSPTPSSRPPAALRLASHPSVSRLALASYVPLAFAFRSYSSFASFYLYSSLLYICLNLSLSLSFSSGYYLVAESGRGSSSSGSNRCAGSFAASSALISIFYYSALLISLVLVGESSSEVSSSSTRRPDSGANISSSSSLAASSLPTST